VEYHQYYDNMSLNELNHNPWLIVIIEAAWYCESRHVSYIRYTQLKTKSNEKLNRITEGKTHTCINLGGTYESIISRLSDPSMPKKDRFLTRRRIKVKGKKETRIYPNIPLIQKEVKVRQAENLDYGNKTLIRLKNKIDSVLHPRRIIETPVTISESITRQIAKTRALSDSSIVSERLGNVVTHVKPKKVSKKK
jgi:hypothetical protein